MFIKTLIIAIFAAIPLLGDEIGNRLVVMIPPQDGDALKIPAHNLKVGESGIITRSVNGNDFIIASVIVGSVDDDIATLQISEFDAISDIYMPRPLGNPAEKDRAIFRTFYDRAVLIAPNQATYQTIVESYPRLDFIHSDIFAAYLAKNDVNLPQARHFRGFCKAFNVGLVVVVANGVSVLDCESFKPLQRTTFVLKDTSEMLPFFTRISQEMRENLFDMDAMRDYHTHYEILLNSNQ